MDAYFSSEFLEEFVGGASRAFWVVEWARNQEERGKRVPPGSKLEDLAPHTPLDAYVQAGILIGAIEAANKASIYMLAERASEANVAKWGEDAKYGPLAVVFPDEFGWCLAMMSMGEGVGWFDDHPKFKLKVPLLEYHPELP